MIILSPTDYITMPWKNGGGKTCQLAISDQCHIDDELPLWRLSIATIAQDGPFSLFEHYQRCIMLLEGAGMRLRFNQQEWITINTPLQRQLFSGQWQTDCELIDGTIKDFNLMVANALHTLRLM
ncbi:HutD family protein [Aliikangiella maris]|uniref:HutD family protein n=2 Tax=Aliikangiella maris TaxID=3162458 RepID=A0ABV2BRP6_9GAMM